MQRMAKKRPTLQLLTPRCHFNYGPFVSPTGYLLANNQRFAECVFVDRMGLLMFNVIYNRRRTTPQIKIQLRS